ncbi:MAG: dTDP-4-dehydrorhamnose reductase [Anaerolineaceae bacterium]|nr:dTDP-4-dehydrorhamnose reductase [Anaerolineaceae bacterium]
MRILLFGKNGQLGWELQRTLACLGNISAYDFPEVDFTKPEYLRPIIDQIGPTLIINAAAYTDVDQAEREPEKAYLINATSVGVMAEEAHRRKIPLIHFSTDYVFDGAKGALYTEEDTPRPINVYGQSKLEGEKGITQAGGDYLIFRTSWVYSLRKGGFVNKVLEWSRQKKTLRVVDDQIANPTWARMLAEITAHIIGPDMGSIRDHPGLYHLAGSGFTSRYNWAKSILELDSRRNEQVCEKLQPAKTSDFPTLAQRPLFSALDCQLFLNSFGTQLPDWEDALKLAMEQ